MHHLNICCIPTLHEDQRDVPRPFPCDIWAWCHVRARNRIFFVSRESSFYMALSREAISDLDPNGSPEPRFSHESALIGDVLHLLGGRNHTSPKYLFPRNEIWTCNVKQVEKKWMRRFAEGIIPPPCEGAQCVVINGILYSYGGRAENEDDLSYDLSELFGLNTRNPRKMKWFQVATPTPENDPWERSYCCLWPIGGKIIMFGGFSEDEIPENRVQAGAESDWLVNNEIYEFIFEGREREKGKMH